MLCLYLDTKLLIMGYICMDYLQLNFLVELVTFKISNSELQCKQSLLCAFMLYSMYTS